MRPPIFYILCGNAAYNRGDRGNLVSQLALLRERYPDAQIILDSHRPEVDRGWFDAIVLARKLVPGREQREWLRRADVVIWGGGALLADNNCRTMVPYWLAMISYVRLVHKKPIMAWAQGLVLETAAGRTLAALALRMADEVTVRDSNSAATLRKIGISRFEQTADPAVLLNPAPAEAGAEILRRRGVPQDRPVICISPTFWHFYHDRYSWLPYPMGRNFLGTLRGKRDTHKRYVAGLARLTRLLVDEHRATVLIMPRYADAMWNDIEYCQRIACLSGREAHVHVFSDDTLNPEEFFALWRCFAFTVSVALHDAIFAVAVDRPVLHLFYEPKGEDFFSALEAHDRVLPWSVLLTDDGAEVVAARVRDILLSPAAPPRRINEMRAAARRNIEVLSKLHDERRRNDRTS